MGCIRFGLNPVAVVERCGWAVWASGWQFCIHITKCAYVRRPRFFFGLGSDVGKPVFGVSIKTMILLGRTWANFWTHPGVVSTSACLRMQHTHAHTNYVFLGSSWGCGWKGTACLPAPVSPSHLEYLCWRLFSATVILQ